MMETLTYKGVTIKIEPLELPDRLAKIQAKTIREVVENPEKCIEAYYKKFGKKVVNSDDAKTLFSEYEKDPLANVQAVHEASSILAKLIFRLRLAKLRKGSKVLFTAGGAAAGKTRSAENDIQGADLVYDSVMKSEQGNRQLIKEVTDAGHIGVIIFIYRDVRAAAVGNLVRSLKYGRVVPIKVLAAGHYCSQQAFINDTNDYAKEKGIKVVYVNNVTNGSPVKLSFEDFKKLSYNSLGEVLKQAETSSYEEYERNKETYGKRTRDALEGKFVGEL